ncbi:NAD-dependent dehydratase [Alkalilimnicola ehrlichii]|uniref:GDP-mannose 4,6-dehydratase n=1 Tax=Alkalilimnicola ehrlichii TaxID=351052 RepID=UPI000E2F9DC1|nr:GDP-mannose 4,6-dehydratase [Alkalilimnicola ehrlichii]RFA25386.1 NAD-dependent dehydratase [Alkalilimnicola ehrlichii]
MAKHLAPERNSETLMGLLEWFWLGDYEAVEEALADIRRLGVQRLRLGVSWADYLTETGERWYDWLLPKLAKEVELLPCFVYTPPSLAELPATAAPPRNPKDYADFLDVCITRYGDFFEYVELWNEPNNMREWDFTLDNTWEKFAATIGGAAYWARQRGKRTALGGMSPIDPNWLHTMFQLGVMEHIDVVGIHAFPDSYDVTHEDLLSQIARIERVLKQYGSKARIWLTEVGYPTWRNDEYRQLKVFNDALNLPVERAYWLSLRDLLMERPSTAGYHNDPRDYHFGLKTASGREKLLFRHWAQYGLEGIRQTATWAQTPGTLQPAPEVMVTGGAGFIGSNLVERLVKAGRRVRVVDNLDRPGVEHNLRWLREHYGDHIEFVPADMRNTFALEPAIKGIKHIYHLAAQVAVTTSLDDPMMDFRINLHGTLNLLEAARKQPQPPSIAFASTNKVYGSLPDVALDIIDDRYQPSDPELRRYGIDERRNLDFHSPYGCSKGGADQYLIDYARCLGVPAVVLRMSCIYGPRQFGTEDQGWVAHFLIRAQKGEPITLYGDGRQTRDILFVQDLLDAFLLAEQRMDSLAGRAFNIGGGPSNCVSLLQLIELIGQLQGNKPDIAFADWRPGDQRYYVSDTRLFQAATGWQPQVSVEQGIQRLHQWLTDSYVVRADPRVRSTA